MSKSACNEQIGQWTIGRTTTLHEFNSQSQLLGVCNVNSSKKPASQSKSGSLGITIEPEAICNPHDAILFFKYTFYRFSLSKDFLKQKNYFFFYYGYNL